jgi:hypothetical protein
VVGGIFNLIAAILCTVGAALSAAAMFLSEPGFVNLLSAVGCSLRLSRRALDCRRRYSGPI